MCGSTPCSPRTRPTAASFLGNHTSLIGAGTFFKRWGSCTRPLEIEEPRAHVLFSST
ncbi:unnamed protein product [Ixodes pacificus]